MAAADAAHLEQVNAVLERHPGAASSLLPVLQEVQQAIGYLPVAMVPRIASALNLSRADVHGVISFFHDLHATPPPYFRIQLCRAEACQAVGARALEAHARQSLALDDRDRSRDGLIGIEPVYCLGNCASGPTLRVGDEIIGRVTAQHFDALCRRLRGESAR